MRTETLRSAGLLALTLVVLYLLQSAVFSRLRLWGVAPLILPLLAVAAGLCGGGGWGGGFGLAAGLLCDVSLGGGGLLFTVYLTAAGFFAGFLGQFVLAQGFPSFFLLALSALLLSAFFQMFRPLFFEGEPVWPYLHTGLKQTAYSLPFSIPVYFIVRRSLRPWLRKR